MLFPLSRGSYIRARVSMNLFGKLRKRNAMRGLPSIYVALSLLIHGSCQLNYGLYLRVALLSCNNLYLYIIEDGSYQSITCVANMVDS